MRAENVVSSPIQCKGAFKHSIYQVQEEIRGDRAREELLERRTILVSTSLKMHNDLEGDGHFVESFGTQGFLLTIAAERDTQLHRRLAFLLA